MTPLDPAAQQAARARRPSHAPAAPLDLDAQIELLEQRLVAREAWVLSTSQALVQRAQQAVTPRSWWLPALGGPVALWLGWRWWRGRSPARPSRPSRPALPVDSAVPRADGLASLPWAGLVALAWPLLPSAWRTRVSPAAATAAVSSALVIARRLVGRRAR